MTGHGVRRLLIANRGEVAVRIARAAAGLDIETVSVFSEDDRLSLHVCKTDKSRVLRGVGSKAYLDIDEIIEAAIETECDSVHPGYGFLSESELFASRCISHGLAFIGPDPEHLGTFGSKTRARALAVQCGVPVPKGTTGLLSLDEARAFFESLGQNGAMMIKAVAGGGGRGMRPVFSAGAVSEAYERCQSEAKAAFGSGALYAEELVTDARHIEVQIIGDKAGNVIDLGDRDCTLQRRRQKLIEIAPSPDLPEKMRDILIQSSLTMARSIKYCNLGTFEFLVRCSSTHETDKGIFFLEANPRLQVEHTVTEEVFGVDLVRTQIRIARGESLDMLELNGAQKRRPAGFAIQMRINMEEVDSAGNVLPASGTLKAFDLPSGPGVRVDTAGYTGFSPSSSFDSLLAKLIVHSSSDRYADAINLAKMALREFRIEGIRNNIGLLHELLARPEVAECRVDTRFVEEVMKGAAYVGLVDRPMFFTKEVIDAPPDEMRRQHPESVPDGLEPLRASMRGTIMALYVSEGDHVAAGQPMLVLSAMKMEFIEIAAGAGLVKKIVVSVNDVIETGDILAFLKLKDMEATEVSPTRDQNDEIVRLDFERLLSRRERIYDSARPAAVDARHKSGSRTARENIADLCDDETFVEYGGLAIAAQRGRKSVEDLVESTPADGLVTGIGLVNGTLFPDEAAHCAILAYDYAVLAGTQGHTGHLKTERMMKVAEKGRLPVVLFAEGGGGRPGDTDRVFAAGLDMETFSVFARSSALIPRVGIVSGRCFAGNAALLGCCDVIIATRNATLGLGGPAMIEGAGLGRFQPDEVGPISVMGPNGVVDLVVADDVAAVAAAKQYLSFFQGRLPDWSCNDQGALRTAIPLNRVRGYNMRDVVTCFADKGSLFELRQSFGMSVMTAFARVEGRPIGILANNPAHLGGAIDSKAADKAARFMQLCDAFDLPIISFCDTPGFMVGPASEREGAVRHVSRIFVTAATLTVPYFCIVTRKCYGLGGMAMAAGSLHAPVVTVSWPTGEFGSMGVEGAVRLGFRRELELITDPDQRQREFEARVAKVYQDGDALNVASFFEVDDVIDPAQSRQRVMSGLRSMAKQPKTDGKRRPFVDTW